MRWHNDEMFAVYSSSWSSLNKPFSKWWSKDECLPESGLPSWSVLASFSFHTCCTEIHGVIWTLFFLEFSNLVSFFFMTCLLKGLSSPYETDARNLSPGADGVRFCLASRVLILVYKKLNHRHV